MNITYTGKQDKFYPAQTEKLQAKFKKLAKILDGKGEKSAHVILSSKRGVYDAEITLNYLHHSLVGAEKDAEQYNAITGALEKLEKQILKIRAKRRDVKGTTKATWDKEAAGTVAIAESAAPAGRVNGAKPKVYRVNYKATTRKPMTLDEAMLEIEKDGDYFVYRDAQKDCVSVLLRRPDGHFDLIES